MRMSNQRNTRAWRWERRVEAVRLRLGLSLRKREGFSLLGVSDGGKFCALDPLSARRDVGPYRGLGYPSV